MRIDFALAVARKTVKNSNGNHDGMVCGRMYLAYVSTLDLTSFDFMLPI